MVGLQDTEHTLEKKAQFKMHDPKGVSVQCISLHWLVFCNPLRRAVWVCGNYGRVRLHDLWS